MLYSRSKIFALLLTSLLPPIAAAQSCNFRSVFVELADELSPCVLVVAHRGAHGAAPENSAKAIEDAIAMGVDIIEIDIRSTKDGVPVLLHDQTLDRTTTGSGQIANMTFEEVRHLRLLNKAGEVTEQRVPTLTEVLVQAKGRAVLDLDIKSGPIESIVSRVVETSTINSALFFSGNTETLQQALKMSSSLLIMPRARDLVSTKQLATAFSPVIIHIDSSFNNNSTIEAARFSGSRVWINALGASDAMILSGQYGEALEPLLAHGASIIQTDHPQQVLAYLRRTGRR